MKYVVFLRGINVGGARKMKMSDLNDLCISLGLKNILTYIQSGNIILESNKIQDVLEREIELKISEQFGFEVVIISRKQQEYERLITANPYCNAQDFDISKCYVCILKQIPIDFKLQELENGVISEDKFTVMDQNIYIYYKDSYSNSKLNNNFFENKLKIKATTRNWNTILKMKEMLE